MPTRRTVCGVLAAASIAARTPAPAGDAPRFSGIAVDVGPLRAKGLGPYADSVGTALQGELVRAFADRMGPGPRLVVRITAITLPSYVGGGYGRFGFGGTPNDYMDGEAVILGPRGQVLTRHPQLSALPSNSGGAWYGPGVEDRRLAALAAHYAGWLRRDL